MILIVLFYLFRRDAALGRERVVKKRSYVYKVFLYIKKYTHT